MAKARTILRQRLARQGITADDVALDGGAVAHPLPPALVESTARASLGFLRPIRRPRSPRSKRRLPHLQKERLNTMMISKLKILGTGAMALVVTLAGVQTLRRQHGQEAATPPAGAAETGRTNRGQGSLRRPERRNHREARTRESRPAKFAPDAAKNSPERPRVGRETERRK